MVKRLIIFVFLILLASFPAYGSTFCSMEKELSMSFSPVQSAVIRNGTQLRSTLSRASIPVSEGLFADFDMRDSQNRPIAGNTYGIDRELFNITREIESLKRQLKITFIQEKEIEGRSLHLYCQKTSGKAGQLASPAPPLETPQRCVSLLRREEEEDLIGVEKAASTEEDVSQPSLAGILLLTIFKLPTKDEPRFRFTEKRE